MKKARKSKLESEIHQGQYRLQLIEKFLDHIGLPYDNTASNEFEELGISSWNRLEEQFKGITLNPLLASKKPEEIQKHVDWGKQIDPNYQQPNFLTYFAVNIPEGVKPEEVVRTLSMWKSVQTSYVEPPPEHFSKQLLGARMSKAGKPTTFMALVCAILGSVLGCNGPTPPGNSTSDVTLTSNKDNTLYEDAAGARGNGAGQHMFVGIAGGPSTVRALVAFDVAGNVPAGATITAVELRLNLSRASSFSATTVGLHSVLADWGEGDADAAGGEGGGAPASAGDATWLHTFFPDSFWSSPGGDFEASSSASIEVEDLRAYQWGSADQMVADVQMWLDDPSSNYGWLLMGGEDMTTAKRFDSRENASEADRPSLTVTFE